MAKPDRTPHEMLAGQLTGIDRAVASYLHGLTTPNFPTKVPLLLGEFELMTNTYEYQFEGVAVAQSTGVLFIGACPDRWYGVDSDPGGSPSGFMGIEGSYDGGFPVWGSTAGGSLTETPAISSSTGVGVTSFQLPILDKGLEVNSRYRMTKMIFEVWADSPFQTTQGDITVAVIQSSEGLNDGVLNAATFESIVGLPQNFVRHMEFPLSGWQSGQTVSTHLVPWDMQCIEMDFPQDTASTCQAFAIVCCGAGLATGQTMRFKITYGYETTLPVTYQTNLILEDTVGTDTGPIIDGFKALRPLQVSQGPAGHSKFKGMAAAAIARPSMTKKIAALAHTAPKPGVTDMLRDAASDLLGGIPYVGGFLKQGLRWLTGG